MKQMKVFGTVLGVVGVALPVFAAEKAVAGSSVSVGYGLLALGAALAICIAAVGGALAQGKAVAAAMEGISRNPGAEDKMFKQFILGLVFIESLVIYALLIAFFIVFKL